MARANIETLFTLRCNSSWACEKPVQAGGRARNYDRRSSMPKNIEDWRNYLRAIVERYDGDGTKDMPGLAMPVKHWQIENEFLAQWRSSDEQLYELMRVSYQTIKASDPDARVIGPGITGAPLLALIGGDNPRGWTVRGLSDQRAKRVTREQVARRGVARPYSRVTRFFREAGGYFDILDVHMYLLDEEEVGYVLAWVTRQLSEHGLTKPIWSLEFAVPFHNFREERFNRSVITSQVAGFYGGLDRIFWSSMRPTPEWSENFQRLSLLSRNGVPKPSFVNYALAARLLDRFTTVRRLKVSSDAYLYCFRFADPKRRVWVGWTSDAEVAVSLPVPGDAPLDLFRPNSPPNGDPQRLIVRPKDGLVRFTLKPDPVFLVRP